MEATPGYPSEVCMREVFNLVADHIERRYGIPIIIGDVTDPFTSDLDGAEIKVDYANEIENALFILVHLFGHTIQWNTDPHAREGRHAGAGRAFRGAHRRPRGLRARGLPLQPAAPPRVRRARPRSVAGRLRGLRLRVLDAFLPHGREAAVLLLLASWLPTARAARHPRAHAQEGERALERGGRLV